MLSNHSSRIHEVGEEERAAEEFILHTERSKGREISVCTMVLLKSCTTPGFKDTILKTFLEKMEDKKSDHFWVSFI